MLRSTRLQATLAGIAASPYDQALVPPCPLSPRPTDMLTRAKKYLLMFAGSLAIVLAVIGIVLPILPTTPWLIVAAYCFAKAEPKWERWLVEHPRFGPYIIAWRDRQAIPRWGKYAAYTMLLVSAAVGWWRLPVEWAWLPSLVAILVGAWISSRPDK